MKYQSEIIKQLTEEKGHYTSLPHYESECIEAWVEANKNAYPKLIDYQAEWLNYANEHPIGMFPYETLTDITEATIENVVPYAYKSAILKGQTKIMDELGNECESPNIPGVTMGGYINPDNGEVEAGEVSIYTTFLKCPTVSFVIKGDNKYKRIIFYDKNKTFLKAINNMYTTNTPIEISYSSIPSTAVYMRISASTSASETYTPNTILLIEDTNGNNLYTTHLESVKMPVLTTTGKNIMRSSLKIGSLSNSGVETDEQNRILTEDFIDVSRLDLYTISSNHKIRLVYFYDNNKKFIRQIYSSDGVDTYTSSKANKESYIKIIAMKSDNSNFTTNDLLEFQLMIEQGSVATSYEPYKSNILTVNEDVTLRSNGSVYDELDLLTGKLTQRIDEDGSVLPQEVVKTVDLTVTNQDGDTCQLKPIEGTMYLETSSDTIQPSFSGEIPVEATTQNLASFIEE